MVHTGDHVKVRYRQDEQDHEVRALTVVLATTAPIAAAIAPDLEPDVLAALQRIEYGPYVATAFLTNETTPQVWDNSYAIATPKRSFNVFFNMTNTIRAAESHRAPGSSIMTFSPARYARPLIERTDQEILEAYYRDLNELFPGFESRVAEAHVQKWPQGLAYCFPGRGKLQPTLTCRRSRIQLAGDYLGTWYTETAVQSGLAAARGVLQILAESPSRSQATPTTPIGEHA